MNKRKTIFWLAMLAIGAVITSYLFYIDDWEETHRPGYKSTDSVPFLIGMFTFYTLVITAVIGGICYAAFGRHLSKSNEAL